MKYVGKALKILLGLLIGILIAFPFYWIIISSLKTGDTILQPDLWPRAWTLEHYKELITQTIYLSALGSSTVIAAGSMVITAVLVFFASYAIYRIEFRGKGFIQKLILVTYVFPGILLVVPVYSIMSGLRLIDTPYSLIIMNVTFAAPFCVWLMRGFFTSIPYTLDESASLDGAGRLRVLYSIILPLILPGIATVAIYSFILSWSEFTFSSILLTSDTHKTLPIALNAIMGQYTVRWGQMSASAVLTILPVLVLFAFIGRYFVCGLTEGAIKG
ncbi:MAG: carbohydrate ABC transporter permease [Candidatus Limiplasma sp.]|nr:carbohydrate ABC transporter permease [Candidatus Limiplasma sp.]